MVYNNIAREVLTMNKAHLGLMIGMISCIMASIVLLLVSLLLVFIDLLHD